LGNDKESGNGDGQPAPPSATPGDPGSPNPSDKPKKPREPEVARERSRISKPTQLGEVGKVLSGAYEHVVREKVPDDITDLLNKLR